ncbi:S8 family serine peptidase [Deinococcus misasensis]|uniref:S8 family serine peptidase n=1 Tax=Deinococcus misasensis TaxID=392413 RepID=UPI000691B429|nr:S8 family serine peptidase [Deinococcus misasensis]
MRHSIFKYSFNALVLGVLLTACGGGSTTPTTATIEGQVGFLNQSNKQASPSAHGVKSTLFGQTISPDVIPGKVLVKYRQNSSFSKQGVVQVAGKTLKWQRTLGNTGMQLMSVDSASPAETLQVVEALKARPEVEFAQPDYMMYPMATPNDPFFAEQWHYQNINLPAAWDITKGSNVTVAVLDTGIIGKHPDFAGKLLPGYDFVTLTANTPTGDGNSRDSDPEDNGTIETTSFHGSHVAGTIAAATNNGVGVAGVSWGAKILPVRVLGLEGGSLSDIIDGLLWAGGEKVNGVPDNANPAQVINMSLGGMASCADLPAYQAVFDLLKDKGIIVVVAAGNSNMDASQFSPASCGNVITVGSTGLENDRSSFSNYGARIDVMAPGGEMAEDLDNNGDPDGVLSISRQNGGAFNYMYLQGTSMAAPHVAGVVALLKSVKPDLNYASALQILQNTATPLTNAQCRIVGACGAGLINALSAVQAAQTNPTPDFNLVLDEPVVTLEAGQSTSASMHLSLTGGFNEAVGIALENVDPKLQAKVVNLGNNNYRIDVTALANSNGNYTIAVTATSGNKVRTDFLTVQVKPSALNALGTYVIACALTSDPNNICDDNASEALQVKNPVAAVNYGLKVSMAFDYVLMAWLDKNQNDDLDNGDYWAFYTENGVLVSVAPGSKGVDLPLELYQDIGAANLKPASLSTLKQIVKEMTQ